MVRPGLHYLSVIPTFIRHSRVGGNPSRHVLPGTVRQWHLVGEKDQNVPPELVEAALVDQPGVELLRFPTADHHCCWQAIWRRFLERFSSPAT